MQYIKTVAELSKHDTSIAGGKGASLGEMTQAGIPVPPGFVVLASAFDAFLAETDMGVELRATLDTVNVAEMHTVEQASARIQSLILQADMSADIADEIIEAYEKLSQMSSVIPESAALGGYPESRIATLDSGSEAGMTPGAKGASPLVAVRSSATAEDGASAAWAGQLETFLNTEAGHVLEYVQKCWASLFTPRAIFYGFEKGFYGPSSVIPEATHLRQDFGGHSESKYGATVSDVALRGVGSGIQSEIRSAGSRISARPDSGMTSPISVAVVIQVMVQSEISGIAFSVHPVTQDRNQIIIEAGYGLGEAVVSGQVTPDSYVVTKNPLEIIDKNVVSQERMLVRSSQGGNVWVSCASPREERLGEVIGETDNNSKRDHLSDATMTPSSSPSRGGGQDATIQKLSDPQILELSQLIIKIENHYGFPCDIEWAFQGGKFYITQSRPITTLQPSSGSGLHIDKLLQTFPKHDLFKWGPIPSKYFYMSDYIHVVSGAGAQIQFPKFFILMSDGRLLWVLQKSEFYADGKREFKRLLDPLTRQKFSQQFSESVVAMESFYAGWPELEAYNSFDLAAFGVVFLHLIHNFWEPTIPFELTKYGGLALFADELSKINFDEKTKNAIQEILCAPEEASFLKRQEIDLSRATDMEAHAQKYFWIKNSYNGVEVLNAQYFTNQKAETSVDVAALWKEEVEKRKDRKRDIIRSHNLPQSLVEVADLLTKSLEFEDRRKAGIFKLQHYKLLFLKEVAKRWSCETATLLRLDIYDVVRALEQKLLIYPTGESETAGFYCDGHGSLQPLENVQAKQAWDSFENENADTLRFQLSGVVVSRGLSSRSVAGRVKVILRPQDAGEITEPYILVTSMTSPDFIYILKKAKAIITDVGGLTSHAAIVSRELGIPCIVNTGTATKVLRDGDLVEVDANNGVVRIVQRA